MPLRDVSKAVRFTPTPSRGRALHVTMLSSQPAAQARCARTGQRDAARSGVSMKGNGAPFPFSHKTEEGKNEGKTMKIGGC